MSFKDLVEKSGKTIYRISKESGVNTSILYRLESGERKLSKISLSSAVALAKALDVTAEDLLQEEENEI